MSIHSTDSPKIYVHDPQVDVASTSLATFGHDATLGDMLVQIVLEGETASAVAVL
jgi:hypothetical protein